MVETWISNLKKRGINKSYVLPLSGFYTENCFFFMCVLIICKSFNNWQQSYSLANIWAPNSTHIHIYINYWTLVIFIWHICWGAILIHLRQHVRQSCERWWQHIPLQSNESRHRTLQLLAPHTTAGQTSFNGLWVTSIRSVSGHFFLLLWCCLMQ